ncbi:MAG TPA: ABC transporter permease [Symbiobacteriaceae bacterium]|jgi:ABC-type Na+ efflux pump permease subunit|nr:ABC transporter permease [Symbiobacteriaceae bacterium]
MNNRAVWAIAKKDLRAITANMQVWLPMTILPVVLGLVIPTLFVGLIAGLGVEGAGDMQEMIAMLDKVPFLATLVAKYPTLDQQVAYLVANYMLAPFFLLIPLMTSSVIAADSFAGEKERGTLETLLFAPADLLSLFVGKMLAAFIPAVGLSLVTFALSAISVNMAGWSLFHSVFFPSLTWLPLMLLVIPMLSLLSILVNIFISARVATFQAAYQMGGLLVLPVLAVLVSQFTGALVLSGLITTVIGVAMAALNAVLLKLLVGKLDRTALFESQVR